MTEATMTENRRFISIRVKLLVSFTLVFTVVFAAAYFWFYTFAINKAMLRIQEDLQATVYGAGAGLSGDELLQLYAEGEVNEAGFSDHPLYEKHMRWLQTIHAIEPRAWPYTYIRGTEENEIIYLTDLWSAYDPSVAAAFKESKISKSFSYRGLEELTFRTDDDGELTTYQDQWGSWTSAYTPVYNRAGEIVGAVGVDFEAYYVDQIRNSILNSMGWAFAITYVVLFALVLLASGAFSKPIQDLTVVAQAIGDGNYEQDEALQKLIGGRFHDEIDKMATVFRIMVDKVHQRETKLQEQVVQLRIEINEALKEKQVKEIEETDFFRELQTKASDMRRRSRGRQAEKENE